MGAAVNFFFVRGKGFLRFDKEEGEMVDIYQVSMCKIMQAALTLFGQKGYKKTGVRQIADTCGVSLGLINHYFGSKRMLAQQTLLMMLEFLSRQVEGVPGTEDPLVFDITEARVQIRYLLSSPFRQFYLDTLEEGIMFESMLAHPEEVLAKLRRKYAFSEGDDYIMLYTRYLPSDMEKILVLGKEAGQFQSISYDEIPFLICRAAKERFFPQEELLRADAVSQRLAGEILETVPAMPGESFVREYICGLKMPLT